jgi:hypothetical protein
MGSARTVCTSRGDGAATALAACAVVLKFAARFALAPPLLMAPERGDCRDTGPAHPPAHRKQLVYTPWPCAVLRRGGGHWRVLRTRTPTHKLK